MLFVEFGRRKEAHTYFFADKGFYFFDELIEVGFVNIANDNEVHESGVLAFGEVAGKVHFIEVTEFLDNLFYYLVEAHILEDDAP